MAGEIPNDMAAKREVLYGEKATDEERNALADAYLDAERFGEALELLEATRDADRLARVRKEGFGRGDTFLLLQVERLTKSELPKEDWRAAAERAKAAGRYLDAWRALNRMGEEEAAETLRAEHLPDFRPFRPEGK